MPGDTEKTSSPSPILIFSGKVVHYDNLLEALGEHFKDIDLTKHEDISSVSDFILRIFEDHFNPTPPEGVLPSLTYTVGDVLVSLKFLQNDDVSVYVRKGKFFGDQRNIIRKHWTVFQDPPQLRENIVSLLSPFVEDAGTKSIDELREQVRLRSSVSEEEFDQKWAAYLNYNREACRAEKALRDICAL